MSAFPFVIASEYVEKASVEEFKHSLSVYSEYISRFEKFDWDKFEALPFESGKPYGWKDAKSKIEDELKKRADPSVDSPASIIPND